jgi:hypothetical protein
MATKTPSPTAIKLLQYQYLGSGWGAWIRTREWRNQKSLGYFDFITVFSRLRRKVLVLDQYVTSDFPTTATAHLLPKRFFWGVNPHSPSPSSLLYSADAHPGPLVGGLSLSQALEPPTKRL